MSQKAIMWALVVVGLAMVPQVSVAQVENLLNNSSFEVVEPIPGPSWNVWFPAEGEGSTATIDTRHSVDGSGSCRINAKGTAQWHFYVTQNNIAMEVGETYTLSFWAKAQSARDMSVLMKGQNNDGPEWCNINAELTTEWTEYHVSGECTQANAKLDMSFGSSEIPL
ncbi:MAG: carbohydrate binding domain-containing protein [Phycisphaeraceae bacterium]|nr:carbohydrate binding domain-containing protein [Phycisphaeraceae bacterium]